jgi:uncharacterized membrane protein (UPF0182 family)
MPSPEPRGSRIGPLLVIFLLTTVIVPGLAGLYLDVRWFQSLGFSEILRVRLVTQVGLFAAAAAVSGGFLYANLRLARRWAAGNQPLYLYDPDGLPRINLGAIVDRLVVPASGVLALLAGIIHYPRWQTWVLAVNATPFGKRDAIFGRDVGFYVFSLPLWDMLVNAALFLFGASTVAVAALYIARGALQVVEGETRIAARARKHLAGLVALVLATLALSAYLETFNILYSTMGPMTGASYADVNAKLPALRLMVAAAAVAAVLVLISGRRESLGLAFAGVLLYAGAQGIAWFYPGMVHRFSVQPNELEREAVFLKHNIDATRAAYGLDAVSERELGTNSTLTLEDIAQNADTVDNVRLWDHQPLLDAFAQIQEIRTYYDFTAVDNDRYMIGGKLRQTMLSARELPRESITNPTWINTSFTYTHGYGIALGPVNEATPEGMPVLFVQDIPPVSVVPDDIDVKQPAIYFGERSSDFVFVRTRSREFDYPSAKDDVKTDYEGKDGIRFDSPLVRAALSITLSSIKVLLSDDIDSDSRVLLHRNIRERIARVAPFLAIDNDPYMVVRKDGTLVWICDAYTITDRYPYSEPSRQGISYIRNSVKAVVDAYHGTVTLYVADAKDPIINAWQRAFPSSFTPLSKIPDDLRAHLRYPELVFDIQTEMFATYHMNGSELLYNREDQWEVPTITGGESKTPMRPYYTVMKLPGEQRSEFILMLPFTPKRKDNLAAWMVARSDGDKLGQLVVYRFPKDRLVFGPQQVVTRINQDPEIARQISLWDQRGSKAEFGTLLVVPIEESLLYVRPLYLRSEGGKIPELKRVIVALENRIAMAPSLREAIEAVFKGQPSTLPPPPDTGSAQAPSTAITTDTEPQPQPVGPLELKDDAALPLEQRALVHFERAIAAQREGDWARYGEELRRVEALLRDMQPNPTP